MFNSLGKACVSQKPSVKSILRLLLLSVSLSLTGCLDNPTPKNTQNIQQSGDLSQNSKEAELEIQSQNILKNGVREIIQNICQNKNIHDCVDKLTLRGGAFGDLAIDYLKVQAHEASLGLNRGISFVDFVSVIVITGGTVYNNNDIFANIDLPSKKIYSSAVFPYTSSRTYIGTIGRVQTPEKLNLLLTELSFPPLKRVLSVNTF